MASAPDPAASALVQPARPAANPFERAAALFSLFPHRRAATFVACLGLVATIAVADLATGYEFALSLLYLVPVFACTWVFGVRAGLALSVLATAAWLLTDVLAGHQYSHPAYRYWEFLIKLSTFGLFALMLGALKRALERSDDRLIKVLEGLDAAVCVVDPATNAIVYRNHRFETVCSGQRVDRAEDVRRLLGLDGAQPDGGGDAAAASIGGRWFLVRSRELTWTDARPVTLVTATDITEQRSAEQSSRAQQERLEATARMVAVSEIASSIAHELNQPLAAMGSYLSGALRRLRAGSADPQAIAGAIEEAGRQAERAGQIIRRVRDFVRSREISFVATDLNDVVIRALRLVAADTARLGARVELELAPSLPAARADPVMIEQVVVNLVRNALEAMAGVPPARRAITISTGPAQAGTLAVTLADTGPGLAPEAAARIFEPFFTTKAEGMGLGLNICRSIVEAHGGRLSTGTRATGGCEFRFTVHAAGDAS
jgi:signal transduction histidine kinase